MQYLMVLLVSAGVFLLMLAGILGASFGLGALLRSRGGALDPATGGDPCSRFQADRDWYDGLPVWQRYLVTAWWLMNRYQSSVKGCG